MVNPSNFLDVAVNGILNDIVSYCMETARFDSVNQHEPRSSPGNGLSCSVWVSAIRPVTSSGLSATSGIAEYNVRIYMPFLHQPYDQIDPTVMAAAAEVMGALTGDFSFGEQYNVRNIDLLGAYGRQGLWAQAGYLEIDRQICRVMTIFVPVIVNDMFAQVA